MASPAAAVFSCPPVRFIDPSLAMFHYEMELLTALQAYVSDLVLLGTPVLRDPDYPLPATLPPVQGIALRRLADKRGRIAGKSVQGYEYILNRLYSLVAVARCRPRPLVHVQFFSLFGRSVWDRPWFGWLRRFSARLVYTVHNVLPHDREHDPAMVAHYRRLYHQVDHLIVHSEYQRRLLRERFGVADEHMTVIPHGPLFYRLTLPPRPEAARRLGCHGPGPYVLHFGHMRPYKGTELLLEAMAGVVQHYPQAVLLLAGPATTERSRALQACIERYNLDGHVHAHFGYVPTATLAAYFALADVVVMPYLQIDQSGVLLSALGLGLPVIASDSGGVSEMIRAQDLGYLTPVGDGEALTETLLAVLASPDEARAKARRARTYVCTELAWSRIAAATVALYRRLLS